MGASIKKKVRYSPMSHAALKSYTRANQYATSPFALESFGTEIIIIFTRKGLYDTARALSASIVSCVRKRAARPFAESPPRSF